MGVFCEILVNRPQGGWHKAGRPLTGIVRYTIDEPTQYKDILLTLVGKGKCKWYERRGQTTVICTGQEMNFKHDSSLHEKGSEGDFTLQSGTYDRPFAFGLPYNIPSSYIDGTCTIKYKLVLTFVKSGYFSSNKSFETEIYIIGNVNPTTTEEVTVKELEKNLFAPFKSKKQCVKLQSEVTNNVYKAGQNVQVNYKVTNDSDVIIPSIKAELIRRTVYTANSGRKKKSKLTISQCTVETPSVPDNAIVNIISTISLPHFLYTVQNSRILSNDFRVLVTLKLPMPFINASIKIPIVVGERCDPDVAELAPGAGNGEEDPPTYFEAMNESNKD